MANETQTFYHKEFGEIGVIVENDKFYFPATKCAEILGYTNPHAAVIRHCVRDGLLKREGVSTKTNQFGKTSQQPNTSNYISEGNLYRLIIRSKLESAQRFESWVFDEVLPSIRKHGAYITPELLERLQKNADETTALLKALTEEQQARVQLQERNRQLESTTAVLQSQIDEVKPKLTYYDLIMQNPDTVPVTLIAKDYGMSAIRFNALLHEMGIQYCVGGTWCLYQGYANNGYTHGNVMVTRSGNVKMHTCWTQKGRLFLYETLKHCGILPKIEKGGVTV